MVRIVGSRSCHLMVSRSFYEPTSLAVWDRQLNGGNTKCAFVRALAGVVAAVTFLTCELLAGRSSQFTRKGLLASSIDPGK
jgi:hypothetical protein